MSKWSNDEAAKARSFYKVGLLASAAIPALGPILGPPAARKQTATSLVRQAALIRDSTPEEFRRGIIEVLGDGLMQNGTCRCCNEPSLHADDCMAVHILRALNMAMEMEIG